MSLPQFPRVRAIPLMALYRAALLSGLIATIITVGYFALQGPTLGYGLPQARAHVADAFRSGELGEESWLRADTMIGTHQFNDCLILLQAIDQRASPRDLRISPLSIQVARGDETCPPLKAMVSGKPSGDRLFYHRYLHGHTMLTRLLLPHMSVHAMRMFYKAVLICMLMAGLGLALRHMIPAGRRVSAVAWAILFAIFSRYFGIESFGQSLGHGPSDIVLIGGLLGLCGAWAHGGVPARCIVPAAATFGALTTIFEFLTGGIPVGAAILIGALPLALRPDDRSRMTWHVGRALVAYGVALMIPLLVKALLLLATFGTAPLADAGAQLALHMARNQPTGIKEAGPVMMLISILAGSDSMAAGVRLMVFFMLLFAGGFGIWGYRAVMRNDGVDKPFKTQARLLALSNLPIIGWILLFWEHMIEHARFMDRILTWSLASGFALFALGIAASMRPSSPETTHAGNDPS